MPSATAALLSQISEITQLRRRTLSEGDAKDYLNSTTSANAYAMGSKAASQLSACQIEKDDERAMESLVDVAPTPPTTDYDSLDDGFESDSGESEDRDYRAFVQLRTNSCLGMPTSPATFPAMSLPFTEHSCIASAVELQLSSLVASGHGPASDAGLASQLMLRPATLPLMATPFLQNQLFMPNLAERSSYEASRQPVRQSRKRNGDSDKGCKSEARQGNLPTTVCFRNIPNNYSTKLVTELLDEAGFKNSYDFLYLPHDFKRLPSLVNVGYFFVNFISHDIGVSALEKITGFRQWKVSSRKVLTGSWAAKTQGKTACIDHCKYFTFMHDDIPDECKPLFFEHADQTHNI